MKTFEEINLLVEQEKYSEAVEAVYDVPESERTLEHYDLLALSYFQLGEYDLSLEIMQKLCDMGDRSPSWYYRTGLVLCACHMYRESAEMLETCMSLNPPENIIQSCEQILEAMSGKFTADNQLVEMYSEEEMKILDEHINKYYGKIHTVLHEVYSPDVHVDICIIEPTKEKNYYTLVTMGMGAHHMNVPDEIAEEKLDRAELVICLPPDWKIDSEDEKWYWPIRLLKNLARLPIACDTWLGFGHTVSNQEPFADNTALCGTILVLPQIEDEAGRICRFSDSDEVNFYLILPIYEQEMKFKINNGSNALLRRMSVVDYVVDTDREDTCQYVDDDGVDLSMPLDNGLRHTSKIPDNNFDLDEICGFNHMAIFMRWCFEHKLTNDEFNSRLAQTLLKGGDYRELIRDDYHGDLTYNMFNDEGVAFAKYYYGRMTFGNEEHFYPCDIDDYALHYFGEAEYNDPKYNTEAYLFIPYDEKYYEGMSEYINRHYEEFKGK